MSEYVFGVALISAFACWYLFWPGALLAIYGIAWLREDARAPTSLVGWAPQLRRASFALLAIAPLLLVARILATPNMAVNWFDFESFDDWPKWFTDDLLSVAPWVQVGAAALVVAARRGTRWASACVAVASVLMLGAVGSSRVDLQACKLEYSIVSPK